MASLEEIETRVDDPNYFYCCCCSWLWVGLLFVVWLRMPRAKSSDPMPMEANRLLALKVSRISCDCCCEWIWDKPWFFVDPLCLLSAMQFASKAWGLVANGVGGQHEPMPIAILSLNAFIMSVTLPRFDATIQGVIDDMNSFLKLPHYANKTNPCALCKCSGGTDDNSWKDCRLSANWLSLHLKRLGSSQFSRTCFSNSFVSQLGFLLLGLAFQTKEFLVFMFLLSTKVEFLARAIQICFVPEAGRDDSSGNFLWLDACKTSWNSHGFSWLLPVDLVPWTTATHTHTHTPLVCLKKGRKWGPCERTVSEDLSGEQARVSFILVWAVTCILQTRVFESSIFMPNLNL